LLISSFKYAHSLFLSSYASLCDLHSFPTRRSSDLIASWTYRDSGTLVSIDNCLSRSFSSSSTYEVNLILAIKSTPFHHHNNYIRSEEHTSELQSRENLVCRLLLEKKNNNMNIFKVM